MASALHCRCRVIDTRMQQIRFLTSVQWGFTLIKDLSEDEAVIRLKRWYVAGLPDADWDTDTERSQHSKLGGKSLRLFAEANPDWGSFSGADLDMLICQSCE